MIAEGIETNGYMKRMSNTYYAFFLLVFHFYNWQKRKGGQGRTGGAFVILFFIFILIIILSLGIIL